jgi:hypothetical protein
MSGRDTRRVGSADRQDLITCWDCAVRGSLMPPDINHWDAMGLVYTVQKKCVIFLVSVNGAEFPMRNQRRNASPPTTVNCTVRKYLTAREIEKLMDYARKHSRYGHRDATMILVAYRHGLRASEVCDLQWHQVELDHGRMHVRRAKNGTPSVHPIRGDEIRALRKLRRERPTGAYVSGDRATREPPRFRTIQVSAPRISIRPMVS